MDTFRKCIVEFIGTFFLVFTVGATIAFEVPLAAAAIAIGLILMVMVYAGGYISGGHYNPAVSLAAMIRGALSIKDWILYLISQLLGAVAAAFLINGMAGGAPSGDLHFDTLNLIIAEFLFTFALCYVVLLTATSPRTSGNSYYGLAIGGTVLAGILAVGTICFAAFNPAVALAVIIFRIACCIKYAFITLGMNFAAGALAGLVYRLVDHKENY